METNDFQILTDILKEMKKNPEATFIFTSVYDESMKAKGKDVLFGTNRGVFYIMSMPEKNGIQQWELTIDSIRSWKRL